MCGIFGYNGERSPNREKLIILGLLNTSRGKDSCGFHYGNACYHGHRIDINDDTSDWKDFMARGGFKLKKTAQNRTFIGHTRARSSGATNVANAHPFLYWEDKELDLKFQKFKSSKEYLWGGKTNADFVLAMNGTLKDFNTKGYIKWGDADEYSSLKWDNDSHMLGDIIFRKGFDILAEYKGGAALAFQFLNEPNSLYLWSGASKEYATSKEISIERPLHYFWSEEDKGIYFSSEAGHLRVINQENAKIYRVSENILTKFENGKIVFKKEFDRTNVDNWASSIQYTPVYYGKNTSEYADIDYGSYNKKREKKVTPLKINELEERKKEFSSEPKATFLFYKDFKYYIFSGMSNIDYVANGVVHLDLNGKVVPKNSGGQEYFFEGGYSCLTEKSMLALVNAKMPNGTYPFNSLQSNLNPRNIYALIATNGDIDYYQSTDNTRKAIKINGFFRPLFSKNEYVFNKGKHVPKEAEAVVIQLPGASSNGSSIKGIVSDLKNLKWEVNPTELTENGLLQAFYLQSGCVYDFTKSVNDNSKIAESYYADRTDVNQKEEYRKAVSHYLGDVAYTCGNNINALNDMLVHYLKIEKSQLKDTLFLTITESHLYNLNLFFAKYFSKIFNKFQDFNDAYVDKCAYKNYALSLYHVTNLNKLIESLPLATTRYYYDNIFFRNMNPVNLFSANAGDKTVDNFIQELDNVITTNVNVENLTEKVVIATEYFDFLKFNTSTTILKNQIESVFSNTFDGAIWDWNKTPNQNCRDARIKNIEKRDDLLKVYNLSMQTAHADFPEVTTIEELEETFYNYFEVPYNYAIALYAQLQKIAAADIILNNKDVFSDKDFKEKKYKKVIDLFDKNYNIYKNYQDNTKNISCNC